MACAGRGRGLLQSVMTEGNKQLQLGHSGSCCGAPFPLSLSAAAVVVCTLEPRRMTVRKHQMAAGSRRSKQWTTTTGDDGVVCNCCQSCCLAAVHDRVWFIFFFFWAACVDKTSIHKCQLVLVRCSCCSSCRCSSLEQLQRKLQHFNIILQPKEAIEETFAACTLSDL